MRLVVNYSKQAHTTTYGLDGRVLSHARDSRKAQLDVKYFQHQKSADEPQVLIVPMTAYDLVLGLPWLKIHNPGIDWGAGGLLSLRANCQPDVTGKASISGPDIQTLSVMAFGDLCASDTSLMHSAIHWASAKGYWGLPWGAADVKVC